MTTTHNCDKCKREVSATMALSIYQDGFHLCEDCIFITRLYLKARLSSWESKKISEEHQRIEREGEKGT